MRKKLFSIILTMALLTALIWPSSAIAGGSYGNLTITGGTEGVDYSYASNTLTINNTTEPLTITGTTTADKIVVAGASANIIFSDLNITSAECPVDIGSGSNVTLTLANTNTLTTSGNYSALRVPSGSTLTLSGSGSLTAAAANGAAIGGSATEGAGTVNIDSGVITASATGAGAGIGGGNGGAGGAIHINGGTVTASSSTGSDIGGGAGGANGSCQITGGSVKADIAPAVSGIGGSVTVYPTQISLQNVATPTAMTSMVVTSSGSGYAYAISGARTDSTGKIFVYLPAAAETTKAQADGKLYYGSITTTSDGAAAGTLNLPTLDITDTDLDEAVVGTSYSYAITYTRIGEGTLTFSTTDTLPTGITLDSATGVLSGTAQTGTDATYPITVSVTDGTLNDSASFSLVVDGGLTITTSSLDSATLGTAYSYQIVHTYSGSYGIGYNATGLPTGLSINSTTGLISGTPTTNSSSPYSVVITATAATSGETTSKTLSLTVANSSSLSITTTSLTAATIGASYSQQISDTLSGSGVTYTQSGFPAWLSISGTGLITGTPPTGASSSYSISVTAAATGYTSDTENYTLTVNAAPVLDITTAALTAGTVGTTYGQTIACTYTGSHSPLTYSLNTGSSLPAGLSMSTAGYISGTPTTAGTYTFGVTAAEQSPGTMTDTATISLTINAATSITIATDALSQGEVGVAFSQTLTRTYNGSGTVTYSATGLPSGLTINTSTGVISGTPAWDTNLASPYLVTLRATDGTISTQKTLSMTIIKRYVIQASAGSGGTISPSGTSNVLRYSNQTYTFKADSGHKISSVTVDGVNKGAISSYTFSNIIDPHTISVKFTSTSSSSNNDDDDDDDDNTSSSYTQRTLTDTSSGITISGSSINKLATLKVEDIALHKEGDCAACDAIRARVGDTGRYSVVLEKNLSLSHAFTGTLTITMPVDPKYNGTTISILHCKNNQLDTLTAQVTNGKATFTVTSLSPFAAFVDMQSMATPTPAPTLAPSPTPSPTIASTPLPTATPAPQKSASSMFLWLLGGIIVLALVVTIFVRMRNR